MGGAGAYCGDLPYSLFIITNVLCTGALSEIVQGPNNTLVARCMDNDVTLYCISDGIATNTISWTYDGDTRISPVCNPIDTTVFHSDPGPNPSGCGIVAVMDEARITPNIISVSGPYGCTDQTSNLVTHVALVVTLGTILPYVSYISALSVAEARSGLITPGGTCRPFAEGGKPTVKRSSTSRQNVC